MSGKNNDGVAKAGDTRLTDEEMEELGNVSEMVRNVFGLPDTALLIFKAVEVLEKQQSELVKSKAKAQTLRLHLGELASAATSELAIRGTSDAFKRRLDVANKFLDATEPNSKPADIAPA